MNDSSASRSESSRNGPSPSHRVPGPKRLLFGILPLAILVAIYAAAGFWLAPQIVGDKLPAYLAERYGLKLTMGPLHFNPFSLDLEANDIALRGPDGALLLQAGRLAVDYAPSGLWHGRWTFDSVSLTAMQLNLVIAKDGSVNLVDLLHRFASPATAPATAPPRIVVDRLELARAGVLLTDLRGAEPAKATIAPIDLTLTGLSTVAGQKTTETLAAGLPDGATLRSHGDLVLQPALAAHGQFELHGLQAASWLPFFGGLLRVDRLQGGADLSARYAYTPGQGLRLDDIALRLRDLALPSPTEGGPALTLGTLAVDGGAIDLDARRFAAQAVSIEGGSVAAARNADGSIDWVRRYAPSPVSANPTSTAGGEWRYDIGKLSVGGIDVALTDRSQTPAFDYGLRLESATVQHLTNVDGAPVRFDARVAAKPGGTLQANGSIAANGTGLRARVEVEQLALAPFAGLIRRAAGLAVSGGPLTLATTLSGARNGFALDDLSLQLPDVRVQPPAGGEPLFAAAQVQLQGARASLADHRVVVDRLTVANGSLRAEVRPDGRLDWQGATSTTPTTPTAPTAKPPAPPSPGSAWDVRVAALQLQHMAVHYLDRARPAPLRLDVGRMDIGLSLQAATGGAGLQVAAQGVQATVKEVAVAIGTGSPPALALDSASLADGRLDLAARRVGASRLVLSGGSTRIVRDAKGRIDLLDAVAPPTKGGATTAAPPTAPWQYAIDKTVLRKFALAARDQACSPPLALDAQLDATLDHLASTGPAAFDATLLLAERRGRIKASGTATPATGNLQARVVADSLDLTPLQPLLSRYTTLQLKSGRAGSDLTLTHARGASDAWRATGAASLDTLALDEAGSGAHFLSLSRLDARQLAFVSGEPRLTIGEIEVVHPDVRIAIAKDRSVNLAQVVTPSADDRPPAAVKPGPAFGFSVQQVRLHDASADFSDQSLVLPFATRVDAIDATAVGISNDAKQRADVQARGSIAPYGSASVTGNLLPADPRRHTDLEVKFSNVTLQPFSPYTATFAGRTVRSGKLWLDLGYQIDDGQLLGKNDIRLSQFTLGEPVESKSALNLPLNLAVSLLTDSKGEINLSVPVRGDIDDPHFSVGDAIGQAFRNTLGRIVSAPFRLIGRLFGADSGDALARVDFAAGSAALAPEQREKLDTLAKALSDRPLLQLVVGAPYDAPADTLAMQRAAARRQLDAKLGREPASDDGASLVAFDDPATRSALIALQSSPAPAPAGDDRQAYEALFDRIARQQPLGADSPQILATQRAGMIARYLAEHGIDRSRVRTGTVEAVAADSDGKVDAELTVSAAGAPG